MHIIIPSKHFQHMLCQHVLEYEPVQTTVLHCSTFTMEFCRGAHVLLCFTMLAMHSALPPSSLVRVLSPPPNLPLSVLEAYSYSLQLTGSRLRVLRVLRVRAHLRTKLQPSSDPLAHQPCLVLPAFHRTHALAALAVRVALY